MGKSLSLVEKKLSSEDRIEGTYYSSIEDVFWAELDGFAAADWENLRRTPAQVDSILEYLPVINAMEVNGDPALGSSRSESLGSDIPDLQGTRSKVAQGAYLFPHNKTCAVAFGPAAELALGQNLEQDELNVRTRKRHRLVVGVLEKVSSKRRKQHNSGLKHNVLNKVRIKGQKEYMDNRPCMLIIPILSLDETKAWKSGDPYSALVCIGGSYDDNGQLVDSAADVYKDVFIEFFPRCSRNPELSTATELLSCFTKGLAYSLTAGELLQQWDTNAVEREKLETVRNGLMSAGNQVHIPHLISRRNIFQEFRVAKVHFDADNNTLPNPPDPYLLAVKAAIIWSWRNAEKLLPGCLVPEEDECSECDKMQQYADRLHEERIRPCNHLKIAQGLGLEVDEKNEIIT